MKMQRIVCGLVIAAVLAVGVTGCSKEKARAKFIAKQFFADLVAGDYTSASRFVHDDDTTSLYENWQDMASMVKDADDWSYDVELTSKTKGKAVVTAEFGKGKDKKEVAVSVDLRRKEGEWWVRVAPNPKALEERAKKMEEARAAKNKKDIDEKVAEAAKEGKEAADEAKAKADAAKDEKPKEEAKPAADEKPKEEAKPAEEAKADAPKADAPAEPAAE